VRNFLLLTSTVRPRPDQPQLKLSDPEARLADYAGALEAQSAFLARGVVDGIVYADISGFDLAPLKERFVSPRIEWLSFYDLDHDPSYHRGYGEFRLVDRAHRESQMLSRLGPGDRVWKVTGRYVVRNLPRVLAMTPRSFDLYCDVRGIWAEMGFMAWSRRGYDTHIRDLWRHFATGKVPELILAERLRDVDPAESKVVTSWYWPPFVVGRRGSDGSPFQGRWTPVKFAGQCAVKLVQWPARTAMARRRAAGEAAA
jgi:hypothetical protein